MSARELTGEQGWFGCPALSACVHTTVICKGNHNVVLEQHTVSTMQVKRLIGCSQGSLCLRKSWRGPSADAGDVTGWISAPVHSPEFDGAGGTASLPGRTPRHICIISHHIIYSIHRESQTEESI